jgi:hypothetical protein
LGNGLADFYFDGDVIEHDGFVWRFTSLYGEPCIDQMELSGGALRTLNTARKSPWSFFLDRMINTFFIKRRVTKCYKGASTIGEKPIGKQLLAASTAH